MDRPAARGITALPLVGGAVGVEGAIGGVVLVAGVHIVVHIQLVIGADVGAAGSIGGIEVLVIFRTEAAGAAGLTGGAREGKAEHGNE